MVDCNAIIEGAVKIRDGKKWKSRWCLMTKLSPVADCLHLQLYRDSKDRWKLGQAKTSLSLQHFLGLESGFTLDKESNTIAIICQDTTVVLGFDTRERLVQWQVKISKNLGEGQKFMVQVVSAPSKSKLTVGPARLHVRDHCFSLTSGLPPRVLGSWDISHLRRYGVVDGGRFCFEGGSRCGKGEGVHVLATAEKQGEAIVEALRLGSQGRLLSLGAPASPTPTRPLTRNFSAMDSPQRMLHSRASDTSCTDSITGQHSLLCHSNVRLGQSLGEVCSERGGPSLSAAIATCSAALQPLSSAADSWAWNSSVESCFSSPSPSCCFHATLHHHLHHHHHMHHHHCNVVSSTHVQGPISPTTPVLGHDGSGAVEGPVRDGLVPLASGGEVVGERGLVAVVGGDRMSLYSHGSGGESEYSVPPRYATCPPAKSASSSSSASTASTSTCSSLSCSWYDRPRLCRLTSMVGGGLATDVSHMESSGVLQSVKVSSVPTCLKYHHPLPSTLPRGHTADAYENYDVPKNVLAHPCVMMENKRKIPHFPRDNQSHSSISAYCDHYDTPRKLKETLGGVLSNGAYDGGRLSAISNYDTPARMHHMPCCCVDHPMMNMTVVNVPLEPREVVAKQSVDKGGLCQTADVGVCSPSSPSPSRTEKNESPAVVDVKGNTLRKCSTLGLSLPHNPQICPYSNEILSQYTSGVCCYGGPNFCMENMSSRTDKIENGKKNVQVRHPVQKNQSALYENLNFAQSLEHYENVKEILVRTEIDNERRKAAGSVIPNDDEQVEDNCHERGAYSSVVCKKCGHSLCCPVRENESMRPGSSMAYADSDIYNNLPAPAQSGAYNSGSESTNQSPKKQYPMGRLSEKSASIPSLGSFNFEVESGMLSQKSRYNFWQHSSAPNLSQGEGNCIGIWDYHIRQLASSGGRTILAEDSFSLTGCYPCNCQDLMTGCLQDAKSDCSQTEGKLSQCLTSLGPTSSNSSVVSSTSASVASLQLPSNPPSDTSRDAKKPASEKFPTGEEDVSRMGSQGGGETVSATGGSSHPPAAGTVHIVRRSSGNPGRPSGGGSGGNRDSSGSNDSGVSSTGSVSGGMIMGATVQQFPNRSSSPLHPRCKGARFLSHPSPCCFHASLPHPRSNCNLQTSPMHSQPHLNSLRSRSSSDPLRHLSFSSPMASTSGLIDMDVNLEPSKSPDLQRTVKYKGQKGGAYSQH